MIASLRNVLRHLGLIIVDGSNRSRSTRSIVNEAKKLIGGPICSLSLLICKIDAIGVINSDVLIKPQMSLTTGTALRTTEVKRGCAV